MSDGPRGLPCYEIKFVLDEPRGRLVEAWADRHLPPDPHCEAALGNAYRTLTLYLDTPELDVFRRGRRKYRARRYGTSASIFLERKARTGDRVRKRRAAVAPEELSRLREGAPLPGWAAAWFHRLMLARSLRPVCLVAYERVAYLDEGSDWPLRLTIDRGLRGVPACGWDLVDFAGGPDLLPGACVLELKFRGAMPALFKQLVVDMDLRPSASSKYRRCVVACGLDRAALEVRSA